MTTWSDEGAKEGELVSQLAAEFLKEDYADARELFEHNKVQLEILRDRNPQKNSILIFKKSGQIQEFTKQ